MIYLGAARWRVGFQILDRKEEHDAAKVDTTNAMTMPAAIVTRRGLQR